MSIIVVLLPSSANAAVGSGGNGPGSGGGGVTDNRYGWGWYEYSLNGAGPARWKSGGTTWAQVKAACAADNTSSAIIFVINTKARTPSTAWGYDYKSNMYNWRGKLSSPPPWMSIEAAKAAYDSIRDPAKANFTWGKNVGWFCYREINWSTSGLSTVNKTQMVPGEKATFRHRAWSDASSSSPTNKSIFVNYNRRDGGTWTLTSNRAPGVKPGATFMDYTHEVQATTADIGKQICERINWIPNSSTSSGWESAPYACVNVVAPPPTYDLYPNIYVGMRVVAPGDSVSGIIAAISNGSAQNSSANRSAVVRFVVPKSGGALLRTGRGDTTTASANYGCAIAGVVASGIKNCIEGSGGLPKDSTGRSYPPGSTSLLDDGEDGTVSGLGLAVGDRICYITVVSKYNGTADVNAWRHSAPDCVVVARTPLVQVWGNDTRVGSELRASDATPFSADTSAQDASITGTFGRYEGKLRGSWGEYGVLAPELSDETSGSVSAFGSGSAFNNDTMSSSASAWSQLTFSNSTPSALGAFATAENMGNIPDVADYLVKNAAKAGLTVIQHSGDLNLGDYAGNRVYVVDGTVTLTNNLNGQLVAPNYRGISQMVIIAKSIKINSNVNRVDAWLIASGSKPYGLINTCADKTGNLTTGSGPNSCDTVLTVHGPMMARAVLSRRTGGDKGSPAEVYNLRSDAYMWAYRVAEASGTLRTVYTQDLPPRY